MGRGLYSIPVAFRILIVSSLLLCGLCEFARIRASEPVRVGVSEGTAVDLDGAAVDPLKVSARKVVVLIFVRVDCPISNRYAPTIQGIERRARLDNAGRVAFWLVYPDRSESAEQIRKHKKEFGYDLPALRDVQRREGRTIQRRFTRRAATRKQQPPSLTQETSRRFFSDPARLVTAPEKRLRFRC